MTDYVPSSATEGMGRPCPRCDAQPDEPCRNQFGIARVTTHLERKK